ncbi:GGDEF domain-containing phosphodiesterase [Paraburkholderia sp.]|uniref:putative bifunctional diguanylate cyclase/phosphodiesterase n=1 Tax=Paraburkholderia sp. TaxID=1926495 RepID=UPI00239F1120|nr:GGDEF domain-containing phosphodiesterase [Paraburkholderia sp.]MDE1182780.1 EAL domain-containing protein [Paraburkholderia sp.]
MQSDRATSTAVYDAALAAAPYGVFTCAADGTFEEVNPAYEQLTGYPADELIGRMTFHALHDPAELTKRSGELPGATTEPLHSRYEGEWFYVRSNHVRTPVMLALAPFGEGRLRYVGIVIDMSRYAQSEARLWYVSHHDNITRLPNQNLFTERLDLTIARGRRSGSGFSVLVVELNQMRKLRDALGSNAAELVLQIAGERLRGLVPYDGTIASLGGMQFALLVDATGPAVDALADAVLARIGEPINFLDTTLNVKASIGIAGFPSDGDDAPTLMRRASVALSSMKGAGMNGVQRFSPSLERQAARRFELETMLRDAIDRDQLHLVYQPQVTLATGHIAQVETLLRWQHPSRGLISPAEFVPVAEETGMIERIGEWVMRNACRDASRILRLTGKLPRVAVNVSPQQFRRQNLLAMIESALHDAALDPSYLEVEITEGVLLGGTDEALKTLHALRDLGVEVAVDDFGTGYSSLAYLTRFPLNRLKIDRSFIVRMADDAQSAALVGAIIAMAHALKLRVTAEGVETPEQAQRLAELGCDEAQGFWFARPLNATALRNLLEPMSAEMGDGDEGEPGGA